jgi:hypothetical protein
MVRHGGTRRAPGVRVTSYPRYAAVMDRDAELAALVSMLRQAGLVEERVDEHGRPSLRLTPDGAMLGRSLMMGGEDAEAVLDDLLGLRATDVADSRRTDER